MTDRAPVCRATTKHQSTRKPKRARSAGGVPSFRTSVSVHHMNDVDACPPIWMHANIHAHAPALAHVVQNVLCPEPRTIAWTMRCLCVASLQPPAPSTLRHTNGSHSLDIATLMAASNPTDCCRRRTGSALMRRRWELQLPRHHQCRYRRCPAHLHSRHGNAWRTHCTAPSRGTGRTGSGTCR